MTAEMRSKSTAMFQAHRHYEMGNASSILRYEASSSWVLLHILQRYCYAGHVDLAQNQDLMRFFFPNPPVTQPEILQPRTIEDIQGLRRSIYNRIAMQIE